MKDRKKSPPRPSVAREEEHRIFSMVKTSERGPVEKPPIPRGKPKKRKSEPEKPKN